MDKAKNCIFYLFITYSVIIILLLYNSEKNAITSFEFKDTTDNIYKITQLENQYNNLSKNKCNNNIKQLINDYKKTSYKNGVNVKELRNLFYSSNRNYLSLYGNVIKNCNISEKDKKELITKVSTISVNREDIYNTLKFSYEIRIKDAPLRIMASNLYTTKYAINKRMQLEIIEKLIEITNKGNG